MKVKHLSASNLKTWFGCKAQWTDRYHAGNRDAGGDAANLGKALHETLDNYVSSGMHVKEWEKSEAAKGVTGQHWSWKVDSRIWKWWDQHAKDFGLDDAQRDDGMQQLVAWLENQNWSNREVVSTEQEATFNIPTADGDVPCVYIIDRVDRVTNDQGESWLEIIDYKSGRYQLNHKELKNDLQAKIYALAMWLNHPHQDLYWVRFNYLRDITIGVAFRPAELSEFFDELILIAEEILDTKPEDVKPTIHSGCRFCRLKTDCEEVLTIGSSKFPFGTDEPDVLVSKRIKIDYAIKALKSGLDEIDAELVSHFESDDELPHIPSHEDPSEGLTIGSKNRRFVAMDEAREVVPDEELAKHASLSVGQMRDYIDSLPNGPDKDKAKAAIKMGKTRPSLTLITNLDPF